jgi:hypothetical protein
MAVPYFQFIAQHVEATAADVAEIKAKQIAQDAKLDLILNTLRAIGQAIQDTQQVAIQTREQFFMPEGQ